jgi:hypothetical protein
MRFWVLKAAASTPYAGAGGIVPAGDGHEAERVGSACRRPNGSLAPSVEIGSGAPAAERDPSPRRCRSAGRGGGGGGSAWRAELVRFFLFLIFLTRVKTRSLYSVQIKNIHILSVPN